MSKSVKKKAAKPSTALAVRIDGTAPNQALAMIERFATNKDFDVEKMKALMEMREREMTRTAQQSFNRAMSKAQRAMRPVARDAENQQTRSRYATYTAMDAALRPIYVDHGFGLSFNTAPGEPGFVRVLCEVAHEDGFSKPYAIDMPADGKGAKGNDVMTKTHATGSAVSYGMRYLLKMIFNVAIGEFDDDGNKASQRQTQRRQAPPQPVDDTPPQDAEFSMPEESPAITNEQRKRLVDIVKRVGRHEAEVQTWLKKRYGYSGTKDITRANYDAICRQLEARGPLVLPGDGQ